MDEADEAGAKVSYFALRMKSPIGWIRLLAGTGSHSAGMEVMRACPRPGGAFPGDARACSLGACGCHGKILVSQHYRYFAQAVPRECVLVGDMYAGQVR